jgi:hypothetical protein
MDTGPELLHSARGSDFVHLAAGSWHHCLPADQDSQLTFEKYALITLCLYYSTSNILGLKKSIVNHLTMLYQTQRLYSIK